MQSQHRDNRKMLKTGSNQVVQFLTLLVIGNNVKVIAAPPPWTARRNATRDIAYKSTTEVDEHTPCKESDKRLGYTVVIYRSVRVRWTNAYSFSTERFDGLDKDRTCSQRGERCTV